MNDDRYDPSKHEPWIIGENCFPDAIELPEYLADAWESIDLLPPIKPITFSNFYNVDGDYGMKLRGDADAGQDEADGQDGREVQG